MKTNNAQLAAIMKLQKQLSQKRVNREKVVKELIKKEKKQRVIDNLVNVIEYLRGYHMDDMVPAAMRRAYGRSLRNWIRTIPNSTTIIRVNHQRAKFRRTLFAI